MLADTIKTARGVVAQGWCQKHFSDGNGNHCAWGAVLEALAPLQEQHHRTAYFESQEFLHKLAQAQGHPSVFDFNDAPTTTQRDVLDFFDKALAELGALG